MLSQSFGAPTRIYVGATRLVFKKSDWDVLFKKLGRTAGAGTVTVLLPGSHGVSGVHAEKLVPLHKR